MDPFTVHRQQKETLIMVTRDVHEIPDEDIIKAIRVMYQKVRIRKVQGKIKTRSFYLRMKMGPAQQQVMRNYLNFMFN